MRNCVVEMANRMCITCSLRTASVRRSEIVVDLCPLQGAGEIEIPDLGLRVELVDLPSAFAMPVSSLFYPAEREVSFGADGRSVDVGDAGVELVHGPHRHIHVPGIYRRRQAVLHVIVDREGLVRRPEANY